MAIEFHCPGCGKLVRTPDKSAGKRGQCPHCQTKVQIPMASIATSKSANEDDLLIDPTRPQAPASPAVEQVESSIELTCSSCSQKLAVPAAAAGRKGKCPHCGTVMAIPSTGSSPPAADESSRWRGGGQGPASIQFNCPSCSRSVKVAASAAGIRGQCPHCKSVVQIPSRSSPAARPDLPPGLTPVDDTADADLTGLVPIPQSARGPAPFADLPTAVEAGTGDPLANLPAAGPAAMGGQAAGPFLPSAPAFKQPKVFKPAINVARNGLPWDNQAGVEGAFGKTTKLILFSPNRAFCMMSREGGVGRPLAYSFMGFVGGMMLNVLYAALAMGVVLLVSYFVFQADGQQTRSVGQILIFYGVAVALFAVGYLIQSSFVVLGAFINAGISHLLLMAVNGANQRYETTYRVTAYTLGACGGALFVPLLGVLVFPFLYPVLAILGLKNSHETSAARAAFAVLLPYAILCGCYYAGLLVFSNAVSAVMPRLQGFELPN